MRTMMAPSTSPTPFSSSSTYSKGQSPYRPPFPRAVPLPRSRPCFATRKSARELQESCQQSLTPSTFRGRFPVSRIHEPKRKTESHHALHGSLSPRVRSRNEFDPASPRALARKELRLQATREIDEPWPA